MEAERIYVQHGGDLEEFLHRIEEENNLPTTSDLQSCMENLANSGIDFSYQQQS